MLCLEGYYQVHIIIPRRIIRDKGMPFCFTTRIAQELDQILQLAVLVAVVQDCFHFRNHFPILLAPWKLLSTAPNKGFKLFHVENWMNLAKGGWQLQFDIEAQLRKLIQVAFGDGKRSKHRVR
jgi:hypothetical protein